MSVRAFLAIELEDELRHEIYEIEKEFKKIDAKISYVEERNLHITLKFFGEIDLEGLDKISEKIEDVLSNYKPFGINVKGCGAFPSLEHIKVLWFGTQDNKILNQLHDDLDAEFASIGFDKDKNFSTHVTFGRMKSDKNKDAVRDEIKKYEKREIGPMNVKKIILMKSTLTPEGPVYNPIKEYKIE
ncbi:MAG: RNA 2',3'-cyclic phosphodiesterase [Methanobrevibacter sp.]|uniref:RNA 2',3'-cyclic phosphodiesterase n=1 Tax=Methanobrevibacter sp. TaxID=66852 RepID=UPI0026DF459E|nr:RNA 2',3'-cyclic phosphodiesterase [Methanobrevibacter sp.]MDO5849509.1 RNA 2',3'-cyclic phosphodiesterase [Methanobrevibacter sp.]